MDVVAIDFEASCLPTIGRSYPIEVAVADLGGQVDAWLIRPHPGWTDWDWDDDAEEVHGISRELLQREGLPVEQVVNELSAVVAGRRVFADSVMDEDWLETLAAPLGIMPPFAIRHVADLFFEIGANPADVQKAKQEAFQRFPRSHRAADDACRLAETIRLVALAPQRS